MPRHTSSEAISSYLHSNVDIEKRLSQMIFLSQHGLLPQLQRSAQQDIDVLTQLKWLFLAHGLILANSLSPQKIENLLGSLPTPSGESQLDTLLIKKFHEPYKLYLQRRNYLGTTRDPINDSFTLLNLIRRANSFTDIIFPIGRYLFREHRFLAQFNILIARDLSDLYSALRSRMDKQTAMDSLQQIEKMNESLYNVYYNCYFSKYVAKNAPIFINTDTLYNLKQERKRVNHKGSHRCSIRKMEEEIIENLQTESMEVHNTQNDQGLKSTSTIGSHTQLTHQGDQVKRQAAEFIEIASQLLLQMEMSC